MSRNCTSFALATAHAMGLEIRGAEGTIPILNWIGGFYPILQWYKAVIPASMGQSLKEEKIDYLNNTPYIDQYHPEHK